MKLITILIGAILTMSVTIRFEVGQRWTYKTRPVESDSTLTIVKIDDAKGLRIIHISLDGLKIRNIQATDGFGDRISHLPISEESLKASVIKMIETIKSLPDYELGYKTWRKAFDKGKGGYFTIPVSECVEYVEQTLNQ